MKITTTTTRQQLFVQLVCWWMLIATAKGFCSPHQCILRPSFTTHKKSQRSDDTTAILIPPTQADAPIVKLTNDELQRRIQGITAIATDVDGTLLSSRDHSLSPTTNDVIQRAVQAVADDHHPLQHFFPATGKSRKGALHSLGPDIEALLKKLPGVFLQGLYCVDAQGRVIFERTLPPQAIVAAEQLATQFSVTLIGNCGDDIYCTPAGNATLLAQVHSVWGEPIPVEIPSLSSPKAPPLHKVVYMSDNVELLHDKLRPALEQLAKETGATVTTSWPTILELLPAGCSKALGVQQLCHHLDINPQTELLALGDAENDVGLLQMASIGVAMGNASPIAQQAADIVLVETSHDGGAGIAIERYSPLL